MLNQYLQAQLAKKEQLEKKQAQLLEINRQIETTTSEEGKAQLLSLKGQNLGKQVKLEHAIAKGSRPRSSH
ncbi:MAG: hypothetical protein ACKOAD_05525 [Gammaproteobacteria bacterium]